VVYLSLDIIADGPLQFSAACGSISKKVQNWVVVTTRQWAHGRHNRVNF